MSIKIGILGYGNLGKGVECAIRAESRYGIGRQSLREEILQQ